MNFKYSEQAYSTKFSARADTAILPVAPTRRRNSHTTVTVLLSLLFAKNNLAAQCAYF